MLYYIPEQKMYENRKELRKKIGTQFYNLEKKRGNITYINDVEFLNKIKDI